MVELYWNIGRIILNRQSDQPWGSKIFDRVARGLRAEFPHMKGFSRTNLYNMRTFAEAWGDEESIVQSVTGQLGWTHDVALLNKISDRELRQWYARRAVQHGWSVAVLEHQIHTRLHVREGAAPNNLESRLLSGGTDLAREVAKDPLIFDFLGLTAEAQEHALEEPMTLHLSQTLAEFGAGFAFVGRQYHLDVDGDDFYIDLLLYHVPSDRYVVVELKAGKFKPEHLGQLNFYVAASPSGSNSGDTSVRFQERADGTLRVGWLYTAIDGFFLYIRGSASRREDDFAFPRSDCGCVRSRR